MLHWVLQLCQIWRKSEMVSVRPLLYIPLLYGIILTSCGTSGLLVACGVVSLVGLGETVDIRVGMLLGIWRSHLFLSMILPYPSIRIWHCLSGSTSPTVQFLSHFLKCWRFLLLFWIKTIVLMDNGFKGWVVLDFC